MLRDVVPCAYLRVYQPLQAFPPSEQSRWERYIVTGGMLRREHGLYRQWMGGKRLGFLAASASEGADVRLVGGTYYVCPWRTRLRVLTSLLSFREAGPFDGSDAFVSERQVRRAARELARMRRRDPTAVSFIMQSPWHVPVRWFALFVDGERRIVERDGRNRLTYLTTARKAMRRAERAIPGLRRTDLGPLADLILELHEWLRAFDPRSLVELDYGGLCDLLTWDELDDDHSARDVQDALRALSSEEFPRSAELYQGVITRWTEVRGHESLN
jgi:hypothetical protein